MRYKKDGQILYALLNYIWILYAPLLCFYKSNIVMLKKILLLSLSESIIVEQMMNLSMLTW